MSKALSLALALHFLIIGALVYSEQINLLVLKAKQKDLEKRGTIQTDLRNLYKATDTAMRKGDASKDLPPPIVGKKPVEEVKKETDKIQMAKKKEKPKSKEKVAKKEDLKSILNRIRAEANKEDDRPIPKKKNFPTTPKGEKDATGTGGFASRPLTPGEQALQAAIRKYYEITGVTDLRKKFPNASGYIGVKLVATANHFELAGLSISESSGIAMLDHQCEFAIRKAIENESFSHDVLQELNGKETPIICQP